MEDAVQKKRFKLSFKTLAIGALIAAAVYAIVYYVTDGNGTTKSITSIPAAASTTAPAPIQYATVEQLRQVEVKQDEIKGKIVQILRGMESAGYLKPVMDGQDRFAAAAEFVSLAQPQLVQAKDVAKPIITKTETATVIKTATAVKHMPISVEHKPAVKKPINTQPQIAQKAPRPTIKQQSIPNHPNANTAASKAPNVQNEAEILSIDMYNGERSVVVSDRRGGVQTMRVGDEKNGIKLKDVDASGQRATFDVRGRDVTMGVEK